MRPELTIRKQDLTGRQTEVLDFVKQFKDANGYPPTRAEIAERFNFGSTNAAQQHLNALEKKGWIRMPPGISRGIVVLA